MSSGKRVLLLGYAGIILLTFLAYSKAPFNGQVWDDDAYLTERGFAGWDGLQRIWLHPRTTHHPYYPLTRTVFWIEYQLWGRKLFGYHLVNILFHLFSSLLIWRILARLNVRGSWIAAAVFAVHPVSVESVAWIAERKNVMSAFFYFASLWSFLACFPLTHETAGETVNKRLYLLSLILFLFSLFSKTAFCTLPVALLLIIWWKRGAIRWNDVRITIPFFAVAFVTGVFTIWMEKYNTGARGPEWQLSFLERCLIAGRSLWFYVGKIVFPQKLSFFYIRWKIDVHAWWQYLHPAGAILVLALLWYWRKRIGRGPIVAVGFFIISLLPALSFINHYLMRYTFVADHLQYLPMLGIIVLVVSGLQLWFERKQFWKLSRLFWAAVLTLLSFTTWQQTKIYADNLTLYNDVLAKNKECWLAYNNRGLIYLEHGRFGQAISDFNRSLELNPKYHEGLMNRGCWYFQQQQYEKALADFNLSLQIAPNFSESYRNRGAVYFVRGEYALALQDFTEAIRYDPYNARAYSARGVIFSVARRHDLALQDYSRAIALDPEYARAYFNRSLNYRDTQHFQNALQDALKARSLGLNVKESYIEDLKAMIDGRPKKP